MVREAALYARLSAFEHRLALLERELTESRAQAASDALTGLANRRSIEESFRELQARGSSVVVALLDLDDFKTINDTFGHALGDAALTVTGKALTQAVRQNDVVGRLGGDEFVILMIDVTLAQAEHRLRLVLSTLAVTPAFLYGQQAWFSASCGAATIKDDDNLSSLLRRADHALYQAKRLGKNRVVCADHGAPKAAPSGL